MDTRNFFNLPLFYQYGIGSAGFNIWREVLMHKISTEWVLNKENTNFPLMYDYRIIKHIPNFQSLTGKFLSEYIGYWNNSKAILSRILENDNSRYEVIMFLEYIPMTLSNFLDIKLAQNEELQIDQIIEMLEEQLMSIFSFLNSKGIVHFDPHFENILTDGKSLYLTDFGLVLSKDFLLDSDEIRFLENHKSYDKIYILMELVNTIIYDLYIKPK